MMITAYGTPARRNESSSGNVAKEREPEGKSTYAMGKVVLDFYPRIGWYATKDVQADGVKGMDARVKLPPLILLGFSTLCQGSLIPRNVCSSNE